MKKLFLLSFVSIFTFFISSCSTSQFTMYKPSNNAEGWKIEVKNSMRSFDLIIDGQLVLSESYSILGKELESTGEYQGKTIKMFGYRKYFDGSDGELEHRDQIRIIIDDVEVTTFDF